MLCANRAAWAPANAFSGLIVPPGDDAAILADGAVWTVDTMVEGVHWDERVSPWDVGYKLVAVSVSDLAAMGARPSEMLLAASLPASKAGSSAFWLQFCAGLAAASREFAVTLAGGDTTRSPGPVVVTVSMGGRCAAAPLLRTGARHGDDVWVSGTLGLAGAGWALPSPPEAALRALRHPNPRTALGAALAAAGAASAAMDLSDGLAADLPRLCAASGVGSEIDPSALPSDPAIAHHPDRVALQLSAGEDYELLFTANPDHRALIERLGAETNTAVTRIGRMSADFSGPRRSDGAPWPPPRFSHFAEGSS